MGLLAGNADSLLFEREVFRYSDSRIQSRGEGSKRAADAGRPSQVRLHKWSTVPSKTPGSEWDRHPERGTARCRPRGNDSGRKTRGMSPDSGGRLRKAGCAGHPLCADNNWTRSRCKGLEVCGPNCKWKGVGSMRVLVGWDNESEAELIQLYLGVDENEVTVTTGKTKFLEQAFSDKPFDIILMVTEMPDSDGAFEVFTKLKRFRPETPIVGACHAPDMYRIVRFMTAGMRAYILRDPGGDYMFMLSATLESTLKSVRDEQEQKLAERLREEIESVRRLQESVIPADLQAPEGY
ncbi:MAG TPA: response regulator, partial [Planctomycetaceae bacterium]|nr:response regulator [Planctomycetaceae bacterium]